MLGSKVLGFKGSEVQDDFQSEIRNPKSAIEETLNPEPLSL
jgi:hypothetical protein